MFTIIKDKYIRCFVGLFVFIFLSVATCNSYASVCFLPTGNCSGDSDSLDTSGGLVPMPEICPKEYPYETCPQDKNCDEKDGCYKINEDKVKEEEPRCTTNCTKIDGHRTCTTDIRGCPIVDKECLDDKYLTLQACKNGNNGANCKLVGDCYEVDTYVAPSCSSKGEGWYDECPTGKTCSQAADGCYQVNEDDTNTIYPYMQVVYNENLIDTSAAIDLGVATSDGARPVIEIMEYTGANIFLRFGNSTIGKEYKAEGVANEDSEYLSHAYCENGTVKYTNMGADDHPYRKYCQWVTDYDFWDDNNADDLYELNNISSMSFLNGTQFDLYDKIKISLPYNEDTGNYWECSEDTCTDPDTGKVYNLINIEVYQEPKECPDDKICVKFNVTCNGKKCTTADDEINWINTIFYQSQLVYQSHAIDLDKGMVTWDDFKPYWQNSKNIKNSDDYFPVSENNLIQYDVSQLGGVLDFIELYMNPDGNGGNVAMSIDVKWAGHSIHKAEFSPFDDNTSWYYQPTLYIFLHNNNFKYIVHNYNWDADIYNELEIGSVSKNKNVIEVNVRFDTLDCEYSSEPLHVVVNCDPAGVVDCQDEFERESYLEPAVQVCKKMQERGCVVPKLVYYTGGGKGTKTSYSVKQIYSVNGQGEFVDGYNGSYGWQEINGKNINYKYDAMVPTKKYLYTFHNIPVCEDRYDLELTPFRNSYNACNSDECATYSRIYKFYISEENGYVNDVKKHLVENVYQYKDGNGIIRLPDYDENSFYRDIYIAGEAFDKGNYNKIEIPYKYTSLDLTNEYECPLTGSWSESDKTIYYFTTSEVYGTTSGYHGSWYDLCPLVGRDSPIALIRESRGAITYGDKSRFNLNLYLRESKMEIKPVEKK